MVISEKISGQNYPMKILKSWLQDYIEIKDDDNELSDLLTFSGSLVDSIENGLSDKIIVAKIMEINSHPNADKLHLVKVDTGKEALDIVCGAPNIEVGQIVPLALVGAKIGDIEIKEAEIRGQMSVGMLCSEQELGLGDDHSGIKILTEEYSVGDPLKKYLGGDTVFDLEITPNRGDCLSHIGIAREYSALTGNEVKLNSDKVEEKACDSSASWRIKILSKEHCSRYFGILIKNVKIGPSPDWLKNRLAKIGQSSINNVVDITNYIMFDLGQPLHAFDAKKLKGSQINIRDAEASETITTIDGMVHKLETDMLVIADSENPVAVAGVMGGFESEIDENTTDILLEAAEFERKSIRKTSKDLKLTTEASYRFERGIDPNLVEASGDKAAKMILEMAGGEIFGKVKDIAEEYTNDWVTIPEQKINDLLGTALSSEEINKILTKLGFSIKEDNCQAPTWRHDIVIWQDLAEEIARIYGFTKIKLNPVEKTAAPKKGPYYIKEKIKDILVDAGFSEVYGYTFLSDKDVAAIKLDANDLLEVANPVQPENKYMRNSLLPGLLRAVAKNPAFDPVLAFEIGNVFTKEKEDSHLSIVASGKQAKKSIDSALTAIKEYFSLIEVQSASELNRDDLTRFKIKKPVTYIFEISIEKLLSDAKIEQSKLNLVESDKTIYYRPISKYPSITRDLAFIVENNVDGNELIDLMYEQSDLINRIELFDEFSSDKFGENKKNIAFHLDLQHQDRTLTDKEADDLTAKITAEVKNKFGGEIRNY